MWSPRVSAVRRPPRSRRGGRAGHSRACRFRARILQRVADRPVTSAEQFPFNGYQETNGRANGTRPRDVFAAARKAAAAPVRGSDAARVTALRSEEHTSELQSLMRNSY